MPDWSRGLLPPLLCASVFVSNPAFADETRVIEGAVPDNGLEHFFVPFEVPAGVQELELHHDDLSEANILDFGLDDSKGYRGWGGGSSEAVLINALAASRAYVPGTIVAGTWKVVVGKAKLLDLPGKYRIEVTLRTTPTLAPQTERTPYVPALPLSSEARWYAADFHVHSRESTDAKPDLDALATFAEGRGLDVVEVSDHNTITQDDYLVHAQAAHPKLLLMPGVEFTTYHGHGNALGATTWVDHKIGQPGITIDAAVQQIHKQGALFAINHPKLDLGTVCIGCAWDQALPSEAMDAVEIATGGWKAAGSVFTPKAIAFWDDLCAGGRHLAAIGGSDDHEGGQGTGAFASPIGNPTTMVFASELSAKAILAGIREGRTVVKLHGPDDPMVELDSKEARAGDSVSGARVHLTARVTRGDGSDVTFVKDGQDLVTVHITGDPFVAEVTVTPPIEGETRVRAEVWTDGVPHTVTSHLWLRTGPESDPPSGSCGCRVARSDAGGEVSFALVLLTIGLARRRFTGPVARSRLGRRL